MSVASAGTVNPVSGDATYQLDDAQPGFTNFGPAANSGIDFHPNFSAFQAFGQTAVATLNFPVFGNDAGGGNVFTFHDFDSTLEGTVLKNAGRFS